MQRSITRQVFFTATNGGNDPTSANSQSQNYAPLQQLKTDLNNNTVAKYNWITPDQYNDMHSSLNTSFTYNGVTYAAGTRPGGGGARRQLPVESCRKSKRRRLTRITA